MSSSLQTLPTESQLVNQESSAEALHLKNIQLLIFLIAEKIYKITNILRYIQDTKLYHKLANIPYTSTDTQHIVEENSILQLESCLCQCTRLTFDINNMYKSLIKFISNNTENKKNGNVLRSELKHFEEMLKKMTTITAENELLNIGLKRTSFFNALTDSSVCIQEEDRRQHLNDFKNIISNCDTLHKTVLRATDFVESVLKRDYWSRFADLPQEFSSLSDDSPREESNAKKKTISDSEFISLRQLEYLQNQLDEVLKTTQRKSEKIKNLKEELEKCQEIKRNHEIQIKELQKKLKVTEKLFIDGINENMILTQKMKHAEEQHEKDRYIIISGLSKKFNKVRRTTELSGVADELFTNITKSRTQLKILQDKAKEEKEIFTQYHYIAEKAASDLGSTNEALKEAVKNLEARNASLLERLKLEKIRTKNMEQYWRNEIEDLKMRGNMNWKMT